MSGLRVSFGKPEGLFIKMDMAKGYGGMLTMGSKFDDRDPRLVSPEPVFYHSGRDLKSTLEIKGSRDLISSNRSEINDYDF
jgi:hypothetical protein